MLTDMIGSLTDGGTFFMFWLGMDDFLLNAVYGGDNSLAPLTPVEFESAQNPGFKYLFNAAMGGILANPTLNGVVVNFPNIFTMPHFTAVPYNPIPMDAPTATLVNGNFAGYNQILDALKGPPFNYSAADMDARKISFAASANNPFVIIDETLNDLGDEFDLLQGAGQITPDQRTALIPYEQVRMTTASDIIPLSTASVLGTLADPNNPLSIQGVAVPMGDRYAIIPTESAAILNRITEFNAHIKSYADGNERVAHADIHKAFTDFAAAGFYVRDGVTITYNINPPAGIYSEDGLHPNSRGYAFIASAIIDGINAKFGGTIPKPNLGKYGATGLPINP
jgi:lysophospholipase L1-like esterase